MRVTFFLLVLANLVLFAWGQGYFGTQEEGREPQRIADQLRPEKLKVALREKGAPVAPPACRMVDKLAAADGELLQKKIADAHVGLAVTAVPVDDDPGYWVSLPGLATKALADKKVAELKQLGVSDFHVIQAQGGLSISLGLFRTEAAATDFLQSIAKKGVKAARVEARPKGPPLVRIEVRGATDVLGQNLPAIVAGIAGAAIADCP